MPHRDTDIRDTMEMLQRLGRQVSRLQSAREGQDSPTLLQNIAEVETSADTVTTSESVVSGTVTDSFEDGDITEYSSANGTEAEFTPTTTQSYLGSYSLYCTVPASGVAWLQSLSGLPYYPVRGDRFEFYWRPETTSGYNFFRFASQDSTSNNHYEVNLRPNNSEFALEIDQSGTDTVIDADTTVTEYTANQWHRIMVDFDSAGDGTIAAELYGPDGSAYSQVSGVETTYNEGGVGFYTSASAGSECYWDAIRLIPGWTWGASNSVWSYDSW